MGRREVIRRALEEDWGIDPDKAAPEVARRRAGRSPESSEKRAASDEAALLLAEYESRRKSGHAAGCACLTRAHRVGCPELRARLLAAGYWRHLYDR